MATSSFDTTFRINPDWGVKNLEKAFEDYEKNGPKKPQIAPVPEAKAPVPEAKPTEETMRKMRSWMEK